MIRSIQKKASISLVALTLSFGTMALMQKAHAASTVLRVNGMVCAFCAQGIEKRLSKLPETKAVFVDLKQKIVAVEAKEGMTFNVETLRNEVKQSGYEVVQVENNPHPVEHLKAGIGVNDGKPQ